MHACMHNAILDGAYLIATKSAVLLFGLMHLNIYQTKMTRSQVHKKRVRKNTMIRVRR
jgi:hypothetical protein